jgi:hypothetical protein
VETSKRQHTVSKVVLRRFLSHNQLSVFDRKGAVIQSTGLRGAFHYDDFIAHDANEAERRWWEVENKLNRVYKLIDQRRALDDPDAVATLRDLLAVHWARSPATRAVHERIRASVIAQHRAEFAATPGLLERLFTTQTLGLLPSGPGALDWINDRLHTLPEAVTERFFSERNAAHYQHARNRFAQSAVQIGYATGGAEFFIGDTPVITRKNGGPGLGPHQGVAINESTELVMPISPTVIIGLGTTPLILQIEPEMVEHFNALQVNSFIRWLGCRPGGPADRQLRANVEARVIKG